MSVDMHSHNSNPHHEHPDVVGSRNRLGVILLIVADVSFALGMMFTYFYLRSQNVNNMWLPRATDEQPAIEPVSAIGPWTVTGIAALGLLAHFYGLKGARHHDQVRLKVGGFVALLASALALVLQFRQIAQAPFTFHMGSYVACFYLLTIMNFVHLALTTFIALGNWNRARLGLYKDDHWHVDIVNVWWIWMTVSSAMGALALSFP